MSAEDFINDFVESSDDLMGANAELADSLLKAAKAADRSTVSESEQRIKSASSFNALEAAVHDSSDEQEAYSKTITASKAVWSGMTTAVSGAASVLMNMTNDLLGGEGFGMFKSMIDPIADLMESAGAVAGDLVGGMLKAGGDLSFFGGALEAAGGMAESAGEALGQVASSAFKFVANLALDATEQLWNMFDGAASAGLLTTNGLHVMQGQMETLNLSTKEYTDLIKNQAENMTIFGGTVVAGAKKLVDVVAAGADQEQMIRRLGITYEEQAEMTSDFMESLARTGHLRAMSDQQIADASFEYMQNLTVISALTGKSADAMKKDRDAILQNMAAQAELAKMDEDARLQMQSVLGVFPDELQQGAKEILLFGQVMTDAGLITSGAAPIMEKFINSVKDGGVNADEAYQTFRDDMKAAGPEMRERLTQLAAAGQAEALGKGNAISANINETSKGLFELIAQAKESSSMDVENTKKAAKNADEGVKNIVNLLDTQRKLMHRILKEAEARLPATSALLEAAVTGAESLLDTLAAESKEGGAIDDAMDSIGGVMDSVGETFEIVKEKVGTAMDAGLLAFEKVSAMIDDISKSSTYQMLFGTEKSEAVQTKELEAATGNFQLDPSKANAMQVQEEMKGASVKQNLETSQILNDVAVGKEGGLADRKIKELEVKIAELKANPTEGGLFTDSSAEQIADMTKTMLRFVELQEEANERLAEANKQRSQGNRKLDEVLN